MICTRGHVLKNWDQVAPVAGGRTPSCKVCAKERRADREALFPVRQKALKAKLDKRYAKAHPDRRKAAHDRWVEKNRARWNAYQREYRAKRKAGTKPRGPADPWHEDTPIGEMTTVGCSQPRLHSAAPEARKEAAPRSNVEWNSLEQDPRPGTGCRS